MTQYDRRTFLTHTAGAAAAVALIPDLTLAGAPRGSAQATIGLIGAGRQGRAILGELQKMEAAKVVAICDNDDARLQAGLRRLQGAEGIADYRKLLEKKEIDCVVIATPTHAHKAIALDAIAAGKHVYCEAPLESTVEASRAIAQAAVKAKTVFHVGMEGRSNPIYQLARTFFRSDAVRDVVSLHAQHHQKTSWRVPASDPKRDKDLNWRLDPEVSLGLPGELGVHQFDVFHWYLEAYPTSVRGSGSIRLHKDGRTLADTVNIDLGFASGLRLAYGATLANSYQGRHEVLHGSNSAIKLAWTAGWMFKEADAPTQGWEVYANRQQFHNDEGITLIADATKLAAQGKLKEGVGLPNPPLYYSLGDFLKSVLEAKPVVSGAEIGLRAAVVAIRAQEAVLSGKEVAITEADYKV